MTNFKEIEEKFELNVYPKRDIVLTKGKGAKVWDVEGKEYIDCIAGHGAVNAGHGNEEILAAMKDQSEKIITVPGTFFSPPRSKLMEKLVEISPGNLKKVFLCNSGTEAVEAAIKFARLSTKKMEFVCAMRGFHGRTLGALSATFNKKYKEDFLPLVPGFTFTPFNNFEKLREKINENTAGIILELVQGEGGINIIDQEYIKQVRKLCDERGVLLIIDEVQTGFCRTGRMFACDHFDLKPDILCLAKSIANGIPMGAVLCSDKIKIGIGKHGTTLGGNPLACATSIATLNFYLENNLAKQAKEKGDYLMEKLKEKNLSKVREVRGLGLMIGIEIKEKVKPYILELMDLGILALPAGATIIRLLPPLIISYEEIDFVIDSLSQVLK